MDLKKGIIIGSLVATSVLPFSSKAQEITADNTKKSLIENLDNKMNKDSLEHKNIISKNIKDILAEYGEKEGIKLINKHLMIEMNIIRKNNGSPELIGIDERLIDFAQKQAEFLDKEGYIYHMKGENILRKRLEKDNIEFDTSGENLALGQETIENVINDRLKSPGHKANILKKTYKKMGLGYKKGTRVLNRIG